MAEDELARAAAWLERTQGVRLAPEALREATATAERLGALAGTATKALPFEAEPSGVFVVRRRLTRGPNAPGGKP